MTRNPAPLWPWGGPIPRLLVVCLLLNGCAVGLLANAAGATHENNPALHPEQTAQTRGQ
jgi:hypothetical protein